MIRRYALRDDQWQRIEHLLPGREGHVGGTAQDNPTGFYLTPGQASDLDGADVLLADTPAQAVIADKAFDADTRVIEPLQAAAKQVVIPPQGEP